MYCGLNNLGQTCYMNSLLQSLFMTRQFREALFRWKYDEKKHPEQQDCIPLQLQLLFAKMQDLGLVNTDAKGLVKSFQWDPQESFAQHDVQEFCRVLFDAIQQSCSEDEEFISNLYQSHSQSFVKCLNCQNESIRNDLHMDLSLIVKSDFLNVYNESLEKALKFYLRPEKLEGDNKYSCSACNTKAEAIKGTRLTQISDILTIQLNRFEFDYTTFQRKKVNDYVSFPFLLDMNNFLKPYDEIQVQDNVQLLIEREKFKQENPKPIDEYQQWKPKNRRPSPGEKEMKKVTFDEPQIQQVAPNIKQMFNNNLIEAHQKLQENWSRIQGKQGQVYEKEKACFTSKQSNNPNLMLTADEAYDIENDMLFGNVDIGELPEVEDEGINQVKSKNITGSAKPVVQNQQAEEQELILEQIEEESHNLQLQEDIQMYLKNGPNVYELYSVMIHSGGAQGGHYYSYIKSFEDNRWYCFNDHTVSKIRWGSIQQMFGEKLPKYNSGTSAYFLMYKKVGPLSNEKPAIPDRLKELLEKEVEIQRQMQERILFERREKEMEIKIRAFYKNKDTVIKARKDWPLSKLKEYVVADLNVREEDENTRLRFFDHHEMIPQETFRGKEDQTLLQLHFTEFKSVVLETKASYEKFEDFDPRILNLKIFVFREDITNDSFIRATIKDDKTILQLQELISQKTGIPQESQIILKKYKFDAVKYSEQINIKENLEKPLIDFQLGQQVSLYIEENSGQEEFYWNQKFDADKYRCTVVFNDPRKNLPYEVPDYCFQLVIDSRSPLSELKERLADFLGIDVDSFMIKRASKSNQELKDLSKPLRDNGIIGRGTIFIQMGKPAVEGFFNVKIALGGVSQQATDTVEFDSEDLFDIVVQSDWNVYQFKQILCQEALKQKQLELDPDLIRLRNKVNVKFGQVYKNEETLLNKITEKQKLCIERLKVPENPDIDDLLIYVKFYDIKAFTLSHPPLELFIKPQTTFDDLSVIFQDKYNIPRDLIEAVKINNLFSFLITDLVISSYDWLPLKYDQSQIGRQPWFIQRDANFIIIRNAKDVPEDLSVLRVQAEQIIATDKSDKYAGTSLTRAPIQRTLEKALKIKVVKKEQQPQLDAPQLEVPQQKTEGENQTNVEKVKEKEKE